jgi:hypothetical protein
MRKNKSPKYIQEQEALKILKGIDWELLRNQVSKMITISDLDVLPKDLQNAMEGIINLSNNIQDFAVDHLGVDERKVYNLASNKKEELAREKMFAKRSVSYLKSVVNKTNKLVKKLNDGKK